MLVATAILDEDLALCSKYQILRWLVIHPQIDFKIYQLTFLWRYVGYHTTDQTSDSFYKSLVNT